ncbi:hypothetical protein [Singulisphaera sp. PoT]|uniref:hypothetical protein n=1 Tax=Singulisphaera sp. PoT TaxID=3411797 RepID=UPI003BF4C95F
MKRVFVIAAFGIAAQAAPCLAQAPAPVLIESGTSLLIAPDEFTPPNPPIFGPDLRIVPAHRLAMIEANRPLPASDPLVIATAERLERLTATYFEDAPRIVELTAQAVKSIRSTNQTASPFEVFDAALTWKPSVRIGSNYPRRFSRFLAEYRRLRIDEKKSHADTLKALEVKASR